MLISFVHPFLTTEDQKVSAVNEVTQNLYKAFNGLDSVKSVEFVAFREKTMISEFWPYNKSDDLMVMDIVIGKVKK